MVAEDGCELGPSDIHSFMSRVMYNRRSKGDPLWNSVVLAGIEAGKPFLGCVDMLGSSFVDSTVATGFGMHLAAPILRKEWKAELTLEEGKKILEDCMRVLYYRDGRSLNRMQVATVTSAGCTISEPYALETEWEYAGFVTPGGSMTGSW